MRKKYTLILMGVAIFILFIVTKPFTLSPIIHAAVVFIPVLIAIAGIAVAVLSMERFQKKPLSVKGILLVVVIVFSFSGGATALMILDEKPPDEPEPSELPKETDTVPYEPEQPEEVIIFPEILLWLKDADVYDGTFLSPKEVDEKVVNKLEELVDKDISEMLNSIETDALLLLDGELLARFKKFINEPVPGEGETSALGLSDAVIRYAKKNESNLSAAKYANYCFLSAELALCAFVFVDDLESSPLSLKALNRLWARFEDISKIPDIPETKRVIFINLAASGSYIRILKSYNDESVNAKRAEDIRDCRVLCIRMMDIAIGHNKEVGKAFALRGNELTEIARDENLTLPGNVGAREDETRRILNILEKD